MDPNTSSAVQTWTTEAGVASWRKGEAVRLASNAQATERMLELAQLRPGGRVLDIAAGDGGQTILAAQRVGPSGSVLATDVSATMLARADDAAHESGLGNVETRVLDAREIGSLGDETFDAAICRFGLMFVPDLVKALQGIRRVLRPDGRLAATVFATPAENPYRSVPLSIADRYAPSDPNAPHRPSPLSLREEGLIAHALTQAGFRDVVVERADATRGYESLDDAVESLCAMSPRFSDLLRTVEPPERDDLVTELRESLRPYATNGGCAIPGMALVAAGTR